MKYLVSLLSLFFTVIVYGQDAVSYRFTSPIEDPRVRDSLTYDKIISEGVKR